MYDYMCVSLFPYVEKGLVHETFCEKLLSFHTEMILALFLWGNVLLRGELQKYAKMSNFKNFENALYSTSRSMPLKTGISQIFLENVYSGPRYWNVPVLVNTGTFLVYQYCLIMWYLCCLEHAGVIQKLTILDHKNGLVLSNTRVPVSGTWTILFPFPFISKLWIKQI